MDPEAATPGCLLRVASVVHENLPGSGVCMRIELYVVEKCGVVAGNALQALRRFEAALDSYGQALKIKPDNAEAYNNRGTALKELKRFEEALAYTQMCERYFL